MNLHVSSEIYAIIKSSDIKIYAKAPEETVNVNILKGTIESIENSEINAELSLRINEKTLLVALIGKEMLDSLSVGGEAYAGIAYNSIIVGL